MTAQNVEFVANKAYQAGAIYCGLNLKVATALVCDNALLRNGLEHILSRTPFVVGEGASAAAPHLLGSLARESALFIVAVGPNFSRMCEMVRQVKELGPEARVVALSDHFDSGCMLQGLEAGIDGFCLTATDREILIKSLELVVLGEPVLPSRLIGQILGQVSSKIGIQIQRPAALSKLSAPGTHKLSAREAEILGCLMHGAPNKVIARKLDVAEATIKVHVKAILRKIGAANRTQAAMWATAHFPGTVENSLTL